MEHIGWGENLSRHAWRHNRLSDFEWSAVERISSIVGKIAIGALLKFLDRDQQHAAIARFIQNELVAEI